MVNDIYYRCHNNLSFIPPARSQEDLRLSLSEAEEDVECWFSHNPDGGPLRDCLQELGCFVQHQNRSCDVILPLDSISEHRVAYYFHKKQAET